MARSIDFVAHLVSLAAAGHAATAQQVGNRSHAAGESGRGPLPLFASGSPVGGRESGRSTGQPGMGGRSRPVIVIAFICSRSSSSDRVRVRRERSAPAQDSRRGHPGQWTRTDSIQRAKKKRPREGTSQHSELPSQSRLRDLPHPRGSSERPRMDRPRPLDFALAAAARWSLGGRGACRPARLPARSSTCASRLRAGPPVRMSLMAAATAGIGSSSVPWSNTGRPRHPWCGACA
jgi:hypothetical protein